MEYIKRYYKIILGGIVLVFIIFLSIVFTVNNINENDTDIVENNELEKEDVKETSYYYIDIKGEVKNPGVYKLQIGKRIIDALNLAGGVTGNADTTNINLSKKITDEMCIIISSKDEIIKENSLSKKSNKVSINTGSIDELKTLSGIGESKAEAIINYREENGLFTQIEDIKNVSGIGESLYEKIKDDIEI